MKLGKIITCYSFLLVVISCKELETNDSFQVFYPPPYDVLFGSKECFHTSQHKARTAFYPQISKLHFKKSPKEECNKDTRKGLGKGGLPSSGNTGEFELADLSPKSDIGLETERTSPED